MLQTLAQLPPVHQAYLVAVIAFFTVYPLVLGYACWTAHSPDVSPRRR